MDITNQVFVSRTYIMEPGFEYICYGVDLKDGMIVLIEDALIRKDPEHVDSDYDKEKLMECNRWCEITQLRLRSRYDAEPLVQFIGVYSDGTQMSRTYSADYCWIVKKPVDMHISCENPECPETGNCGGKCARDF